MNASEQADAYIKRATTAAPALTPQNSASKRVPPQGAYPSYSSIAYILVVGAVLIVVVTIIIACQSSKSKTIVVETEELAIPPQTLQRTGVRAHLDPSFFMGAPLRWDTDEGAFMIMLTVGAGPVELVFDTGSSQVSVKGKACRWTSCSGNVGDQDEVCVVQSCPVDKAYVSTGTPLLPGENGAGTSTTLTYGSQEDTVAHFLDSIHVPKIYKGTDFCASILSQLPDNFANLVQEKHSISNIIVHEVSAITGTSTSNLFGFARAPLNDQFVVENGEFALIEQIFNGKRGERGHNWCLVLHENYGWWLADAPASCFSGLTYVPLVSPAAFSNFVTHFYVIPILLYEAGPNVQGLSPISDPPTWCVVDTGTTLTYGSPMLGASMRSNGYVEGKGCVRITLGSSPSNSFAMTYTSDKLVDPEYPGTCLIQGDADNTLEDYDQIFNGENVLLFGILMMTNMCWNFNANRNKVGIMYL